MDTKKRSSNMELLRILCAFMIIIFHCCFKSGFEFQSSMTINKFIVKSFWMLGELGVNSFIMISGYFMIYSTFKYRKIIKIIAQVLFYSILYNAIMLVLGYSSISLGTVIKTLLPITFNQYWFATAYVLLYLFTPYINKLIHCLSKKEFTQLITLGLFIYCIYPTCISFISGYNVETLLYYNRFIWLIVVYMIGAYVRLYGIPFLNTKKRCLSLFVGSLTMIWLSMIVFNEFSWLFSKLGITDIAYFWPPNTIPMVLLSISLFVLFTHIDIKNNKIINTIASTSFGIYLLHDGALVGLIWNAANCKMYTNSPFLIVRILLVAILIMSAGIIIDLLRQKIFALLKI